MISRVHLEKQINQDEVLKFCALVGDSNPLHCDADFTGHQGFRGTLVPGVFLNALVSGIMGTSFPGPGAMLAKQEMKFPHPCYTGDTVVIDIQFVRQVKEFLICSISCHSKSSGLCILEGKTYLFARHLLEKSLTGVD